MALIPLSVSSVKEACPSGEGGGGGVGVGVGVGAGAGAGVGPGAGACAGWLFVCAGGGDELSPPAQALNVTRDAPISAITAILIWPFVTVK